jgi:hypothetical protein
MAGKAIGLVAIRKLEYKFHICSNLSMDRLTETAVAHAILAAPGWARVGITAPKEWLREDAAVELARAILAGPGELSSSSSAAVDQWGLAL